MKNVFADVIKRGGYDLTGLLKNIDKYHIEGKLTEAERDELYALARQAPEAQYDVRAEIERLWAAVRALQNGSVTRNPSAEEYPAFVQPTGAHDAYHTGDKVTYNGARYICRMDNCAWSPDVLPNAWEKVE